MIPAKTIAREAIHGKFESFGVAWSDQSASLDTVPQSASTRPATDRISADLAAARGVIEGKFLELGKVLESAVDTVSAQIAALDELGAFFNAGAIGEANANLAEAAAKLNGLTDGRGEERAHFHSLADASRQLRVHIEAMQQALRYLHVFAVNIKVTAGGVPGAYEVFEDFAHEVLTAIGQGREEMTAFSRELDELGGHVGAALAQESEVDRRCAELLPATPRQLTADADSLSRHHETVASLTSDAGDVARSLQGKVGAALGGLQIGDTTRQRVEHVEEALAIIEKAYAEHGLTPEGAAVIRDMLAAQLCDTAEIFNRDVDRVAQGLAGVAVDAQEVLRLRGTARGGRQVGGPAGGVLQSLEANLSQAMALIDELRAAEASALEVGGKAEATAEALARRIDTLRGVKTSIHQMALNAHLKCCRLGDLGRPLSVIAVELRVSADDLGETADRAEQALDQLAACGTPVHAAGQDGDRHGAAGVGALLEAAVAPIREAEAKAGGGLASAVNQGEAMVAALREATGRLNFRGEVSQVLATAADGLRASAGEATVGADLPGLEATMAVIAKRYTMAREREIHRRFEPPAADEAAAA